ncbi:Uncharacterised protein [Vibrio cholerae]|uniref:Uncharacterized protein n=1 Tax=Vibrio cholerae TaxID=666 RepID=A0A655SDM8_VIBCL|nr:Uncharacterised protein [Vibrio cholerae]CSB19566.1 Uncharacterised protein [Vibrio cholerae]CSB36853.1 Uncharacterised protein [Vibrio cholerae]CSB53651.1 Uncharacterised protein [Vibrio cholerae]CSB58628.1 Uncharacterised protein [Vibrio cholerae]
MYTVSKPNKTNSSGIKRVDHFSIPLATPLRTTNMVNTMNDTIRMRFRSVLNEVSH